MNGYLRQRHYQSGNVIVQRFTNLKSAYTNKVLLVNKNLCFFLFFNSKKTSVFYTNSCKILCDHIITNVITSSPKYLQIQTFKVEAIAVQAFVAHSGNNYTKKKSNMHSLAENRLSKHYAEDY